MVYWKSLKWYIKSRPRVVFIHFRKTLTIFLFSRWYKTNYMFALPFHDRIGLLLRQFGPNFGALPQMWGWAFGRAHPITSSRSGGFQRLGLAPKDNTQNYCCITNTPFSINFTRTHIQIFEVAPIKVTLRAQFLDDFVLFVSTVPGVSYHDYSQFSNLRYTNIINDFCS